MGKEGVITVKRLRREECRGMEEARKKRWGWKRSK
jgi:hypothetical protein